MPETETTDSSAGAASARPPVRFEITAQLGKARTGIIHTWAGPVQTPVFMPVGTRGSIKGVAPDQLEATGATIMLCNNYHLVVHPGVDEVEALGGLNEFTRWQGPILTDSGGYQVFSLAHARKLDDHGVTFTSPRDGKKIRFEAKTTVEWQHRMGSTFIMQLDECTPFPCTKDDAARAVGRSLRWAREGAEVKLHPWQIMLPIVQGSTFENLRERSARGLVELDAPAYAIGGLSVGEGKFDMMAILDMCADQLPEGKPRYLMGVGKPEDIVGAVKRGVDMFDCVLPTRNARHALAWTSTGIVRLRNAKHKRDTGPLDADCPCYTCRGGFSLGFLRHLKMVDDPTGNLLLSIHNLTYYQRLMQRIRDAITAGRDPEEAPDPV